MPSTVGTIVEATAHSVVGNSGGVFGRTFMFLTRLAWRSRFTLPMLITAAFMAMDFRMQVEINQHHHHGHGHAHHNHGHHQQHDDGDDGDNGDDGDEDDDDDLDGDVLDDLLDDLTISDEDEDDDGRSWETIDSEDERRLAEAGIHFDDDVDDDLDQIGVFRNNGSESSSLVARVLDAEEERVHRLIMEMEVGVVINGV